MSPELAYNLYRYFNILKKFSEQYIFMLDLKGPKT